MQAENYLLILRVWHYGGLVDYEEHIGDMSMLERLAHYAMAVGLAPKRFDLDHPWLNADS